MDSARAPDQDFVAIDTETTGLAWHDRLVEIGAVRFRGDRVIERWRTLVNPRRPIPDRVSAIHGITDADVVDAPFAAEALAALAAFASGAVLLAHNARFDRDVLATEWSRAGATPPDAPMYCTWKLSKHCLPDAPRHGLAALAAHLALPTESSHRALADAELTRRLFLACCARVERCDRALLDQHATEKAGPWSLRGVARRAQNLPAHLRSLRAHRRAGDVVTLEYAATERDASGALTGVPLRFLSLGEETVIELRDASGHERAIEAARVLSSPTVSAPTGP